MFPSVVLVLLSILSLPACCWPLVQHGLLQSGLMVVWPLGELHALISRTHTIFSCVYIPLIEYTMMWYNNNNTGTANSTGNVTCQDSTVTWNDRREKSKHCCRSRTTLYSQPTTVTQHKQQDWWSDRWCSIAPYMAVWQIATWHLPHCCIHCTSRNNKSAASSWIPWCWSLLWCLSKICVAAGVEPAIVNKLVRLLLFVCLH